MYLEDKKCQFRFLSESNCVLIQQFVLLDLFYNLYKFYFSLHYFAVFKCFFFLDCIAKIIKKALFP